MGRYFGTDGIRGKANEVLTAERAFQVGRYLGYYFSKEGKNKIVIGKDTRLSSDMFENALAAGITSEGCDAYLAGYCPTPMICLLTKENGFACGAMISASHNPFYDNGIKVFSNDGFKLSSDIEDLIEDYIDGKVTIPYRTDGEIGKVIAYPQGIDIYLDWIVKEYPLDLSGWKIAIDCANGSSSFTAKRALERLGAEVTAFHNEPNGININTKCGSTHPESLQAKVVEVGAHMGMAYDGDADRLIAVDEKGNIVDGDKIMVVSAIDMKSKGQLKNDTLVVTVMSNIGLRIAAEENGIKLATTQVGDRYVLEEMIKGDYSLGGEQSGHLVFLDYNTTGDGTMSSLVLASIVKSKGEALSSIAGVMDQYPQVLVNVRVQNEYKNSYMEIEEIAKRIDEIEKEMDGKGRVLIRPSGTEPLVRVMLEGKNEDHIYGLAKGLADLIDEKIGLK